MTEKKLPVDASSATKSAVSPKLTEEELQRRIAAFRARVPVRIAGPDDPIYRGGLGMTAVRRPKAGAEEP